LFSTRPEPIAPGPGQESVWDYPRPPRLEAVTARLVVVLGGETIADTTRGYRVLETCIRPMAALSGITASLRDSSCVRSDRRDG
jgi:uncharacterized protein (DUF427 family)